MEVLNTNHWSRSDYCMSGVDREPDEALAATVYDRVCRTDFSPPGFCLIDLGQGSSSTALRRFMVSLKQAMQRIHQMRRGCDLIFLSAGRFDQQVTTKPHRDGGPDECFLMLGYEPSPVRAAIAMSDYSQCAHAMGLSPFDLLEKHNDVSTGRRIVAALHDARSLRVEPQLSNSAHQQQHFTRSRTRRHLAGRAAHCDD